MEPKNEVEVFVSLKGADEMIEKLKEIKKLLDEINDIQLEVKLK